MQRRTKGNQYTGTFNGRPFRTKSLKEFRELNGKTSSDLAP